MKETEQKLNTCKKNIITGMKANFKESGYLAHLAIIIKPDFSFVYASIAFETQEEKEEIVLNLKDMVQSEKAVGIALISESWLNTIKDGNICPEKMEHFDRAKENNGGTMQGLPGTKEVAIMIFETTQTTESIIFDMDRSGNNLINEKRSSKGSGLFYGILNQTINN